MGIAVAATLARIIDGVATFTVVIEPTTDPSRVSHLRAAGELEIGADGWPTTLRLDGTTDDFFNDRYGATTIAGTLSLAVSWETRAKPVG